MLLLTLCNSALELMCWDHMGYTVDLIELNGTQLYAHVLPEIYN